MKASIIHFEVLGKAEMIYCYKHELTSTRERLNERIKQITPTARITSVGHNLDLPDDIILNNGLKNWIENNEKYLK